MQMMPVAFEHSCGLLRIVTCWQATEAVSYLKSSKAVATACQSMTCRAASAFAHADTAYTHLLVNVGV